MHNLIDLYIVRDIFKSEVVRLTQIQEIQSAISNRPVTKMVIIKDIRSKKDDGGKEGIMDRRDIINLCELLFNIGSSKSLF